MKVSKEVYIFSENYIQSDGGSEHVLEVFETYEKAYKYMLETIEEHKDNTIVDESTIEIHDYHASFKDDENTKYVFIIEEKLIK